MAADRFRAALREAWACGTAMKENADYVLEELPTLPFDPVLKGRAERMWQKIMGTGHDVTSELFEVDELLDGDAEEAVIEGRFERIRRWIREDLSSLHEVVQALDAASQKDTECQAPFILVAESATNILKPFARLDDALGRPEA